MDAVSASSAYVAGRRPPAVNIARLTNFYPLYNEANDQVDRVVPVRRAVFQRVIPRYELSTSETRDQGVGPDFIEVPSFSYSIGSAARDHTARAGQTPAREESPAVAATGSRPTGAWTPGMQAPLPEGVGLRIDLWA